MFPSYPALDLTLDRLACFRGGREVFRNINFSVKSGESYQLFGANGSGKTSLLRLVAGLLSPASGTINLSHRRETSPIFVEARQLYLHFISHKDAIKSPLTLRQQLNYWALMLCHPSTMPTNKALEEALTAFELAPLADMPTRLLSAGQGRRLGLCRLILFPRPLWLLDEPLTALDQRGADRLSELIHQHNLKGGLALIASHDTINTIHKTPIPEISITQ